MHRSVPISRMLATLAAASSCAPFSDLIFQDGFDTQPSPQPFTAYTEEALTRGVDYTMQDFPITGGQYGFGAGFADLNDDDHPDIVVLGAGDGLVGVFENDGTGQFTDRSDESGIPALSEASAFAAGDFNGDGLQDLYLTQVGAADILVRNDGNFQFTDVTTQAGLGSGGRGKGASWGDFDGDGWLDLYVANYTDDVSPGGEVANLLYSNNGDGTFDEVAASFGVDDDGLGFQPIWTDYNRDGLVDLYLTNDRGHLPGYNDNRLWRNDGGSFTDVSAASGADVALFAMGIGSGDLDRNDYPDLYATNIPGGGGFDNPLLMNQGDGTFLEQSEQYGVHNPYTSWGALFFDATNNGWPDVYVNNQDDPNTLYANIGIQPLFEVAELAGVQARSGANERSYSSAYADVNADGALDLLVNNLGGGVELFINREGIKRNHLRFRMRGITPNLLAVGGSVDVLIDGRWHYEQIHAGGHGYLGQNELTLHVGAGCSDTAETIIARWPGGSMRSLSDYPVNHTWDLFPPDALGDEDSNGTVDAADYHQLQACYDMAVQPGCEVFDYDGNGIIGPPDADAFFDDYDGETYDCDGNGTPDLQEILQDPSLDSDGDGYIDACMGPDIALSDVAADLELDISHTVVESVHGTPGAYSVGGGAVADFNQDGYPDMFVIGGGQVPDRLYINNQDGTFTEAAADWGVDFQHAGNGASAADYDGNGYPDLFVTSAGVSGSGPQPGHNRLYRNEGDGSFTEVATAAGVETAHPQDGLDTGSAWGDYDRDGDLDLFVTSHDLSPAGNILYRNNGDGTFTDVTDSAGVEVSGSGLFWGFQGRFSDMDGDLWPDLLVAADFGSSRYFTDITTASGTGMDEFGMGSAVGDLDGDTDLDWFVTSINQEPSGGGNIGNMLYLNQGAHTYSEVSQSAGVSDGGWGWGTIPVDLNHNGRLDLVAVNGRPMSQWANDRARIFRNNGDGSYTDLAPDLGLAGSEGRGVAVIDADRDGRQDIIVYNNQEPLIYYANQTSAQNWLAVRLDTSADPSLAPDGFGSRVELTVDGVTQIRYIDGTPSYLATSEPLAHFGMGDATEADQLRIVWADGSETIIGDPAINQYHTVPATP